MNAVQYILDRVFTSVPRELLERAFVSHPLYGYRDGFSTEELVRRAVIVDRVLPDLNVAGGQQITVPIGQLSPTVTEAGYMYRIPLQSTQGRHITSVLSIESTGFADGMVGSGLSSAADAVLSAAAGPVATGSAQVYLVGPNTVMVTESIPTAGTYLRCVLENDPQLANINQRYWSRLSELCILATKMIIYNKLSIALGESGSNGGSTNTYMRAALDEMADSGTLYNEMLNTKMARISILQDRQAHNRVIGLGLRAF